MAKEIALREFLELDEYDIVTRCGHDSFEINPRTGRHGENPQWFLDTVAELKLQLVAGGFPEGGAQDDLYSLAVDGMVHNYKHDLTECYNYWKWFVSDSPAHKLINSLYFLLQGGDNSPHYQMLVQAFNGDPVTDIRRRYQTNDGEYLMLTDSEADEVAADYIRESVEYFNPSFIAGITGIRQIIVQAVADTESNEAMTVLIGDKIGEFIKQAIAADGRGHFIAAYDGDENERGNYYIYRVN